MQLWTWQADSVKPTVTGIDPRCPGSYYDKFPTYRPAFEWLWETLGTDQLLWCFVDENEAKESAGEKIDRSLSTRPHNLSARIHIRLFSVRLVSLEKRFGDCELSGQIKTNVGARHHVLKCHIHVAKQV